MKMIIVVAFALVAVALAAPPAVEPVKIVDSEHNQESDGTYNFGFKSEDGIERSETGEVREATNEEGKPQKVVIVRGSVSYTDPDGNIQTLTYFADENGYHAEGPAVPKVPTV